MIKSGEVALMDGLPACCHPGIFLKDSLPTKSCSKPVVCMK